MRVCKYGGKITARQKCSPQKEGNCVGASFQSSGSVWVAHCYYTPDSVLRKWPALGVEPIDM